MAGCAIRGTRPRRHDAGGETAAKDGLMTDNGHKAGFSEPDTGLLAPYAAEETELFDLEQARADARKSRKAALRAGCPVAGVIIRDGRRVTIREWPDGRIERLVAGEWREWPDYTPGHG